MDIGSEFNAVCFMDKEGNVLGRYPTIYNSRKGFDYFHVLSGLFTLANYDEADPNGVICPFGAGCSTIVQYPHFEGMSDHPRGVIGMLDVSARPCVPANVITFAVPMKKLVGMVSNMEESFLITGSWGKVKRRITSTLRPEQSSR
jgi:hypothetical protein